MKKSIDLEPKQTELLAKIGQAAINLDWNIAFSGKSYGNHHLERVNKITSYLLSEVPADVFLTLAAAWVHDTTLAVELDDDPDSIFSFTLSFLEQFQDLAEAQRREIARCVSSHETGDNASLEAQIVHDADVIDKSGMLGVIRHIWKMTNMIHSRVLDSAEDVAELHAHLQSRAVKVKTPLAMELIQKLNLALPDFFEHPQCQEIVFFISERANQGKISDEIADELIQKYEFSFISSLKSQIECSYLV
jgi:HD superfamily phosphodiesterase